MRGYRNHYRNGGNWVAKYISRAERPIAKSVVAGTDRPHRVRKGALKSCTTGHWITIYLQNGGTLKYAQNIANHESPRTTKLYDLTREKLRFEEVESVKV